MSTPSPTPDDRTVFDGPLTLRSVTGLAALFRDRLTVNGGLENCNIETLGMLQAASATLVGGQLLAAGEVVVGTVGDAAGTPTEVILGATISAPDQLSFAQQVLNEEGAAVERTRDQIKLLETDAGQFDHTKREELTLAMFDMPDLESGMKTLQKLLGKAHQRFGSGGQPTVSLTVKQTLHAGVTLRIDNSAMSWTCDEDLIGPVKIKLNDAGELIAESDAKGIQTLTTDQQDLNEFLEADPQWSGSIKNEDQAA